MAKASASKSHTSGGVTLTPHDGVDGFFALSIAPLVGKPRDLGGININAIRFEPTKDGMVALFATPQDRAPIATITRQNAFNIVRVIGQIDPTADLDDHMIDFDAPRERLQKGHPMAGAAL